MQCDSKVVQLLSERFASGELHLPFHGFVSCVTRLRKLFGNTNTHIYLRACMFCGYLSAVMCEATQCTNCVLILYYHLLCFRRVKKQQKEQCSSVKILH